VDACISSSPFNNHKIPCYSSLKAWFLARHDKDFMRHIITLKNCHMVGVVYSNYLLGWYHLQKICLPPFPTTPKFQHSSLSSPSHTHKPFPNNPQVPTLLLILSLTHTQALSQQPPSSNTPPYPLPHTHTSPFPLNTWVVTLVLLCWPRFCSHGYSVEIHYGATLLSRDFDPYFVDCCLFFS
jgi:hypothetical protein